MGEERTQQHTLLFRINTTHEDLISQGGIHILSLCKFNYLITFWGFLLGITYKI